MAVAMAPGLEYISPARCYGCLNVASKEQGVSDIVIERPSALEEAPVSRSAEIVPARLLPLDMVRGLLMIVMALDHANLFIAHQHSSGEFWNRPLPHYESAIAFLTRFVTHMAAPGFFFLMGAGMILFAEARRDLGWSEWRIARQFVVRGLALIGLQMLVENPAWQFGEPFQLT